MEESECNSDLNVCFFGLEEDTDIESFILLMYVENLLETALVVFVHWFSRSRSQKQIVGQ